MISKLLKGTLHPIALSFSLLESYAIEWSCNTLSFSTETREIHYLHFSLPPTMTQK